MTDAADFRLASEVEDALVEAFTTGAIVPYFLPLFAFEEVSRDQQVVRQLSPAGEVLAQAIIDRRMASARAEAAEAPEIDDLAQRAIKRFGESAQLDQAQEECAELIAAISHYKRGRFGSAFEVAEELADVEIMLAQLRRIVPAELYQEALRFKLGRLRRRVEGT